MSIYADKALHKYNITYKEIESLWDGGYLKQEKGKSKFWTDIYTFENEEEYNTWKEWCIKKAGEDKFSNIDMLYCLGQPYLFKREEIIKEIDDDDDY